ncbi:metallo-beta-lactamase domain protein [Klebsiella pneumoniae]|uniref:Metallo-beta-lactamase domain protein n=1 Tax=Klebsiella pneumoniae TaxID=573 RepID=A0A378AIN5_KLEPN|nr:metallo-beta-lactamase domain protein [Klebsiella pneumoniae]
MNITHIRNATQIIDYAGKRFLIDPMLADKGAWPGFPGTARSELRNPLVELPFSRDKIVDVDAVIVTHTHDDHWDAAAIAAIPKTLPVFVQHEADAALLRSQGFQDLRLLSSDSEFAGVRLLKTTSGQHGSDRTYAVPAMAERLGEACGVVFRHPQEKTLWLVGDTIWRDDIAADLLKLRPDVVVLKRRLRPRHRLWPDYHGQGRSPERALHPAGSKNHGYPPRGGQPLPGESGRDAPVCAG